MQRKLFDLPEALGNVQYAVNPSLQLESFSFGEQMAKYLAAFVRYAETYRLKIGPPSNLKKRRHVIKNTMQDTRKRIMHKKENTIRDIEKRRTYSKKWCKDNPDKVKGYGKKWRAVHPTYSKTWHEGHPKTWVKPMLEARKKYLGMLSSIFGMSPIDVVMASQKWSRSIRKGNSCVLCVVIQLYMHITLYTHRNIQLCL